MTDSTALLPWIVIRQDDNGNRYRVGGYATRAEAQKMADRLDGAATSSSTGSSGPIGPEERVGRRMPDAPAAHGAVPVGSGA